MSEGIDDPKIINRIRSVADSYAIFVQAIVQLSPKSSHLWKHMADLNDRALVKTIVL